MNRMVTPVSLLSQKRVPRIMLLPVSLSLSLALVFLLGIAQGFGFGVQVRQTQTPFTVSTIRTRSSSSSSSIVCLSVSVSPNKAESDVVADNEVKNKPTYGKKIVKPTEALSVPYHSLVESAYVRHILVETPDMSSLIYDMLYGKATATGAAGAGVDKMLSLENTKIDASNDRDAYVNRKQQISDPFGYLAMKMSTCVESKEEGGAVGWIDNPQFAFEEEGGHARKPVLGDHPLLPAAAIAELFQQQPKGGDVLTIPSARGVHLLRVEDVWVSSSSREQEKVRQRKLPGKGGFSKTPLIGKEATAAAAAAGQEATTQTQSKPVATKYSLLTNGCQMNVADSERMEGILAGPLLNLTSVDKPKDANVVVINTCSIRDHAEQKLYDQLGPLAQRKRNGEHLAVVVSGCVAQQEGQKLLTKFPEIDAVMGPQYVNRLDQILEDVSRGHQVVATDPTLIMEDMSRPVRSSGVRAWVNVLYGCNEHCTYCVVPFTRGVEQSRTIESIVAEVLQLADAGYKEVTLLGQNVDAYGRDMTPKRTFAELLDTLNASILDSGMERVRYVTSHPRYFSDRVIDAVADLEKVCECFHVPFQSGSNSVLKDMRRGYTYESYMNIIHKIKAKSPEASICGDVIVGFPGETDADFQRTLDLMTEVRFDNLNTFAYSPRPNTEAAEWTNQVPDEIKNDRLQQIQRLAVQHATERSDELYSQRIVEVLVEDTRNPKNPNQVMGRTRQGRLTFFEGDLEELKGKLVIVQITETRPWSLTGTFDSVVR
jgi:tRNA-2-methylthio-N6-dimethylallyladenosine synthase